jgi:hypothetical protein
MTPPALLLIAIELLPPPPEPTSSPEIDTARVLGVVILSLAVIVLIALALRPFIVKSRRPGTRSDPTGQATEPDLPNLPSRGTGSIIPFPKTLAVEGAGQGHAWSDSNSTIAERFSRVMNHPRSRRKLGDRQPVPPTQDSAGATVHHAGQMPQAAPIVSVLGGNATVYRAGPVVHGEGSQPTRMDSSAQAGAVPKPGWEREVPSNPAPSAPPDAPSASEAAGAVRSTGESLKEPTDLGSQEAVNNLDAETVQALQDTASEAPESTLQSDADETAAGPDNAVAALDLTSDANEIDTLTLAALHQVVRDLIYCANSGELLQGFGLYSDPFLFRFLDSSGMSEIEFRDTYGSVKARPRASWEHLDRLFDIARLPDGRIEATASYVDVKGAPANGLERYRFVESDGIWMIDDIEPIEPAAG